MKKTSVLGLISAVPLIATSAQAQTLANYATTCAQRLGVTSIPGYSCSSGTSVSGANFLISSSNNRVGRVPTSNPNVDAVFLCRNVNGNTSGLDGYILQNSVTGDTCFFDAIKNGAATVPSPNAANAANFWQQPQQMADNCATCHSADPFLSPIGLVSGLKTQGMIRKGRNLKGVYNIVDSDVPNTRFTGWNGQRQIQTSSCASNCHNLSGNSVNGMVSKAVNGNWMANAAYVPQTEAPASIGVWRADDAKFFIDRGGDHTWNGGDRVGFFGVPSDQPVVLRGPDCNDSSKQLAEVGVVRSPSTWFTTKNNVTWDSADEANTFSHGINAISLSWNGVATSFEDGVFIVDVDNTRSEAGDIPVIFGGPGDRPAIGRWQRGIGYRVAIVREIDGELWWYFDLNGTNAWDTGDNAFPFGLAGDQPVVGDFDGDGLDEIGVYWEGEWFIDFNHSFSWDGVEGGDAWWTFGSPGSAEIPVVSPGKWDCLWLGTPPDPGP